MAHGQRLELLFPNLRGGYVHSNVNARTSLNDFLCGTTTAKYVMPGWEVGWLYLKESHRKEYMHPIAVGTLSYQLIGTQKDIMGLLGQRREQAVLGAGRVMDMVDATGQYAPATLVHVKKPDKKTGELKATGEMKWVQTHTTPEPGSQMESVEETYREALYGQRSALRTLHGDMHLHVDMFAEPKPPLTLAREAMLELGANFVGVGGGTFAQVKTLFDIAGFLNTTLEEVVNRADGHLHLPAIPGDKVILELTASTTPGGRSFKLSTDAQRPTTFADIKDFIERQGDPWKHAH